MLKYMVSIRENYATYPELIVEICHYIKAKKTSNLKANKLNQDVLLEGKCKLDAQINTPT